MDDLIYVLLLIAWVAYSFYNAKQKRKLKEQQHKPAAEPKYEMEPLPETQPQRSIFEEIFKEAGLEDFEEQEPVYEPEYEEPSKEVKIFSYEDPETWNEEEKHMLSSRLQIPDDEEKKEPETIKAGPTDMHKEAFDLRKAIIYNAILERPYN